MSRSAQHMFKDSAAAALLVAAFLCVSCGQPWEDGSSPSLTGAAAESPPEEPSGDVFQIYLPKFGGPGRFQLWKDREGERVAEIEFDRFRWFSLRACPGEPEEPEEPFPCILLTVYKGRTELWKTGQYASGSEQPVAPNEREAVLKEMREILEEMRPLATPVTRESSAPRPRVQILDEKGELPEFCYNILSKFIASVFSCVASEPSHEMCKDLREASWQDSNTLDLHLLHCQRNPYGWYNAHRGGHLPAEKFYGTWGRPVNRRR